jgi:hypothetical protein
MVTAAIGSCIPDPHNFPVFQAYAARSLNLEEKGRDGIVNPRQL